MSHQRGIGVSRHTVILAVPEPMKTNVAEPRRSLTVYFPSRNVETGMDWCQEEILSIQFLEIGVN